MENTETATATTTDLDNSGATDMVAVEEADDASIAAFLENATKAEPPPQDKSEPTKGPEETKATETQTATEPEGEPTEEPEPARGGDDPAKDEAALQAEVEKLRTRIQQQEQFIQRTRQEYGDVKKALREANEKLRAGLDDKFAEKPAEATKDLLIIQENERKIEDLDAKEEALVDQHQAQVIVAGHIKPGEVSQEDMAESLRADGLDESYVRSFLANPLRAARPETVIQLAKRAKAERYLRQAVGIIKNLVAENKKLQGKPKEVLEKTAQALKAPPKISAATGGSSVETGFTGDISALSDAELATLKERLLKQAK